MKMFKLPMLLAILILFCLSSAESKAIPKATVIHAKYVPPAKTTVISTSTKYIHAKASKMGGSGAIIILTVCFAVVCCCCAVVI